MPHGFHNKKKETGIYVFSLLFSLFSSVDSPTRSIYCFKNMKDCYSYNCLRCNMIYFFYFTSSVSVNMKTALSFNLKMAASKYASMPPFPVMPWRCLTLCCCHSALFNTQCILHSCSEMSGTYECAVSRKVIGMNNLRKRGRTLCVHVLTCVFVLSSSWIM